MAPLSLLGRFLLGRFLLGRFLLGRFLLGRFLLGRFLLRWFLLAAIAQMIVPWVDSSFLSATAGENLTLRCFADRNADLGGSIYWYEQSLGKKPTVLWSYLLHDKRKSEIRDRFTVESNDSFYNLHIQSVRVKDSAVYHCVKCYLHHNEFLESFSVVVQSSKLTADVLQPQLVDVDGGESASLKCSVQTGSCNGAHSVHWFKKSEESTAGVLYSRGNSSDQCDKSTDSPTNSCFYNLHIHNVSSEQTGTYYCAVAACGQVLFGSGTEVRIKEVSGVLVYVLTGVSVFSSSLVVGLSFCLFTNNNTNKPERSAAAETKDVAKRLQYKATETVNRRRPSHDTWSECVYFSVEQ